MVSEDFNLPKIQWFQTNSSSMKRSNDNVDKTILRTADYLCENTNRLSLIQLNSHTNSASNIWI